MNSRISGSRVGRGDQLGLDLGVDAVEARVVDRRGADPDVDLGRAGLAQQLDDPLGRRPAHDRIVDDDQALAVDHLAQRVELDRHAAMAQPGRRLDERPPGVAVAVHPLAVREPGCLGEAGRRRGAGVGDGHHQVGVDRVLHRQLHPHLATGLVQVAALHVRVGAGEVDELEDAQRRGRLGEADRARRLARLEDDHLARLDVADVLGADDVEGRRLRREAPAGVGVVAVPQAVVGVAVRRVRGRRPRTSGRKPNGSRTPITRRSSRITRLYAPRTRGRTRRSASTVSAAGSSASSAVSSSVSVEAGRRARPPRSCSSRSRVLTRLPLWPIASARRGPSRYVGWAFSQMVEPVVE